MFYLEFSGHAWAAIDFEVAVFMDLFDLGEDDFVLLCSFRRWAFSGSVVAAFG
jgi:hypothetical protein